MATTDVERLVVSLEASITKYERAMNKALGQTNTTTRKIESRFTRMNRNIEAATSGAAAGFLKAFVGVQALRGAQNLIDASVRIGNSLKVAGLEGDELTRVYDRLFASAQKNVAPLETLVTLYGRASLVQKELGVSQEELLGFTDKVALALRVSGQSAEASKGALLQLGQALSTGTVRAEEYNSLQEGAVPILRAVAAGLKEAGGSVGALTNLVKSGQVSSQAFFRAFEAGSYILDEKVAGAELTVSQAFTRLQNVLIDTAGKFNENTSASRILAKELEGLGTGIQDLAVFLNNIAGPLQTFVANLQSPIDKVHELANGIAQITGLDLLGINAAAAINDRGFGPAFEAKSSMAGRIVDQTFKLIGETPQDEALAKILTGQQAPAAAEVPVTATDAAAPSTTPKTISLKDYPITSTAGGKGGGRRSPSEKFSDTLAEKQRELDNLKEETALRAQLNPLIDDGGEAEARLRMQQELLNAAAKAGIDLSPDQRKAIDDLVAGYGQATAEAARLAEAQDDARQQMEDWFSFGRDAAQGFISDLREGKTAAEALGNAFAKLGDQLLNMGLNALFGTGSGANPFGFIGKLFGFRDGGIAAHGRPKRFASGGVSRSAAIFGEAGPEAAVPLPDGRRIPVDLRMPALPAPGGGTQSLQVHVVSDDEKFGAYVTNKAGQVVAQSAPGIAGAAVKQANKSAPSAMARYQKQQQGSDYRV